MEHLLSLVQIYRKLVFFLNNARIMKFYVIEILMLSQQSGAINNTKLSPIFEAPFPSLFLLMDFLSVVILVDTLEWTSGRVHVFQTLLIF